jgi:fructose-bisphosphate aldolase, class I
MTTLSRLVRKGKCLILTYDQGLETGPGDFDAQSVDPERIMDLALEGGFSALAVHIGVAEKYRLGPYKDVPLIIKVNGSTQLPHINPISTQICSVDRAVKAGAAAIGFTIYDGSPNEPKMFEAFGRVCEQAHEYGLPVVAWMYPRGPGIRPMSAEVLAYSARIALELGADVVKMRFNGEDESLKWIVRCAGRSRIVLSSGRQLSELDVLAEAKRAMTCGALGVAVGRNLWRSKKPYSVAKALRAVVYDGASAADAAQQLT